jgi:hypothetical protein
VRAEQIVAQSRGDIDSTRREADEYVIETLTALEMELDRYLNQVRNGITKLREDNPVEQQQVPVDSEK